MIHRLAALLLALTPAAAVAAVDAARIDAILARAPFHGEVLIGEGDRIAYDRAFGTVAPGGAAHVAGEQWRWASVTKQLTALIVMQEVAAGRIDLDAPVATYWPDWSSPEAGTITIRMLLRHQSGLADPAETPEDAAGVPAFYRRSGPAAAPDAVAAGFCAGRRAAPGGGFHYDNCDYLVLGALLERVTGVAFPDLVKERIAVPLGLAEVGIYAWDRPKPPEIVGYDAQGNREPAVNLGLYGAAGGAFGRPQDLWSIDRALMENRLLDRVATAAMWAGEPSLGYAALGSWSFAAPLGGCADPVAIVERRGSIGGVEIRNFLLPERRAALILFSNRGDPPYGEVWQGSGLSHDLLAAIACPAS